MTNKTGKQLYESWAHQQPNRCALPRWDDLAASTVVEWNKKAIYGEPAPSPAMNAASQPARYTVEPTRCNCHPETCACNPWRVMDGTEKVSSHYNEEDAIALAVTLNRAAPVAQGSAECSTCHGSKVFGTPGKPCPFCPPDLHGSATSGEAAGGEREKFDATMRALYGDDITKDDLDANWSETNGFNWRRSRATLAAKAEHAHPARLTDKQLQILSLAAATFDALSIAGADDLRSIINAEAVAKAEQANPPVPVGYVHLIPDEQSQSYDVRFWTKVPMGTKLYAAPVAERAAAPASVPEGWTVEVVGEAIHIKRADGKWTGFMPAISPAHALTYEFLTALLVAPEVAQPAAQGERAAPSSEEARLRQALIDVRNSLQFANDSPGGGIDDTIWMMDQPETIFDFIDAVLATPAPSAAGGDKS